MLKTIKRLLGINPSENKSEQTSIQIENKPRQKFIMDSDFDEAIKRVVGLPNNTEFNNRVKNLGLNVLNVMWEDTARTAGSVWGPNITDMTLQVRHLDSSGRKDLLPVIRYPNFTDKTGDVPLDLIKMKIGNEKG